MNKINSPWFLRLISLLFALLLFAYVNQSRIFDNNNDNYIDGNNVTQLTSTKTAKVSIPLQLKVDSSRYFVTGYPEKVDVKLSGPAALVTATINTQSFKVYADLTHLDVGIHKVKLTPDGLNNELKYRVKPNYIYVNIQPRKTVTLPVKAKYDENNIASGYKAGSPVLGADKVKVTGAKDEIAKIKQVIAHVDIPQNTKKTVDTFAVLEALDDKNRIVNVILTPSTTSVNLPISSMNNKTVPVSFKAEGNNSSRDFRFSSDITRVKVFGSSKELANVDKIVAKIDVSGIKNKKTVTVDLDKSNKNVSGLDPDSIQVTVTPH
jgi:YbbR domain-containing protein